MSKPMRSGRGQGEVNYVIATFYTYDLSHCGLTPPRVQCFASFYTVFSCFQTVNQFFRWFK